MKRHSTKCPAGNKCVRLSKIQLINQSQIMCGRVLVEASTALINEVLSMMRVDEIVRVARNDSLILTLDTWFVDVAQRREQTHEETLYKLRNAFVRRFPWWRFVNWRVGDCTLMDYLRPEYFDDIVNAALSVQFLKIFCFCCGDAKRRRSRNKWSWGIGFSFKRCETISWDKAHDCSEERPRNSSRWQCHQRPVWRSTRVNEYGIQRKDGETGVWNNAWEFNASKKLPLPSDLKKMADYLNEIITGLDRMTVHLRRTYMHPGWHRRSWSRIKAVALAKFKQSSECIRYNLVRRIVWRVWLFFWSVARSASLS